MTSPCASPVGRPPDGWRASDPPGFGSGRGRSRALDVATSREVSWAFFDRARSASSLDPFVPR